MTTRADKDAQAAWKRKLDRLTAAHERARAALNEGIADARAAKVPLTTIADHTPYSREWVRKIADGIDSERTGSDSDSDEPS